MLFDLQSRRRRTAVKIIYLLLAVLMAGGLVLLGVGTGSGNGGFLNSLTGNGSSKSTGSNAAVTAAVKAAEKEVAANPSSASAYANLVKARFGAAGPYYDQSTGTYTATGKALLAQVIPAWTRYASLVKGAPDPQITAAAAQAYDRTGGYAGATTVWQDVIAANRKAPQGYTCLAYTAYASKKTALAQQAAAKAIALTPKVDQLEIKDAFTQVAKSATNAGAAAAANC